MTALEAWIDGLHAANEMLDAVVVALRECSERWDRYLAEKDR